MRRFVSAALVCVLTLAVILTAAGCGGKGEGAGGGDKTVVTVVVADGFGDRSFYDSAKEGLDRLSRDCAVEPKTIECQGENFEQQIRNAADQSQIVVPVGYQFDMVAQVAKDYPDVKFIWCDNESAEKPENLLCITYAQNEGAFLAGYIAAKTSKSGVVGAVGGEDNPTINDFLVGYKQGVEYAGEDVQTITNYTNSYTAPDKGKECAAALNNKGADIIFAVAGNAGSGVFEAAAENSFYAIGVDTDQKYIDPERIICSIVKNVGDSIYDVIRDFVENGTWEGGRTWNAGMSTGYIDIGYGQEDDPQQVSDQVKKEVEALKQDIIDGKIQVETTRS